MTRSRRLVAWLALPAMAAAAALYWLTNTHDGARWLVPRLAALLPEGRLTLQVAAGDLTGPLVLTDIAYRDPVVTVLVPRLEVDWSPWRLLVWDVAITRLTAAAITLMPRATAAEKLDELPRWHLPIRVSLENARVGRLIWQPEAAPRAQELRTVQLAGGFAGTRLWLEDSGFTWAAGELQATGSVNFFGAQRISLSVRHRAAARAQWPVDADIRLSGTAGDLTVRVTGSLMEQPDSATAIQGDVVLRGFERLDITEFALRREGATARLTGVLPLSIRPDNLAGAELTLELDNLESGGPFNTRLPDGLTVPRARVALTGTQTGYRWATEGAAGLREERIDWQASGEGTRTGLDIQTFDAQLPGVGLQGAGQVAWRDDELTWELRLVEGSVELSRWVQSLKPIHGLAARLSGHASLTGASGELHADDLTGRIAEHPLTGAARIIWRGSDIEIRHARLGAGGNRLQLAGRVDDRDLDLGLRVDLNELAMLSTAAAGRLDATMTVSGQRASPAVTLEGNGADLHYGPWTLERLAVTANGSADAAAPFAMTWEMAGLSHESNAAEGIRVDAAAQASGTPGSHRAGIELTAHTPAFSVPVIAVMSGGLRDAGWRGDIVQLDALLPAGGWLLREATALRIDRKGWEMAPVCALRGGQSICLAGTGSAGGDLEARLAMRELVVTSGPAAFPSLPIGLRGVASGDLAVGLRAGTLHRLAADLVVREPRLLDAGGAALPLFDIDTLTVALRADAAQAEGSLIAAGPATADQPPRFSASGTLADPFAVARWRVSPIALSTRINLPDARSLAELFPELDAVEGSIGGSLDVAGSVTAPRMTGDLRISGGVTAAALGVTFVDPAVQFESGAQETAFRLQAEAGGGTLRGSGTWRTEQGEFQALDARLEGEDAQVLDSGGNRLTISPALDLRIRGRQVAIDGAVTVPAAHFQVRDEAGQITASDDVRILGEEPPPRAAAPWQVSTRVTARLGDAVHLAGPAYEARLTGTLAVTDLPGEPLTAVGELIVAEGSYRVMGRELALAPGRVRFGGGPLANPGLELEAGRSSGAYTAGVRVRGTAREPLVTLYSSPRLSDADALAVLLFGRPMGTGTTADAGLLVQAATTLGLSRGEEISQAIGARFGLDEVSLGDTAQGSTSLLLGKYLSPRLFVGYGLSLMDRYSAVTLRYRLAESLELRARSGVNQSADLLYTLQR